MPVPFESIPQNLRVPFVYVEITVGGRRCHRLGIPHAADRATPRDGADR